MCPTSNPDATLTFDETRSKKEVLFDRQSFLVLCFFSTRNTLPSVRVHSRARPRARVRSSLCNFCTWTPTLSTLSSILPYQNTRTHSTSYSTFFDHSYSLAISLWWTTKDNQTVPRDPLVPNAHSIKWTFLGRLSFLRTLKYPHTILLSHAQQHRWAMNNIVPWSLSVNLSAEKTPSPNNHFAEEIHSGKYSLNVKMN